MTTLQRLNRYPKELALAEKLIDEIDSFLPNKINELVIDENRYNWLKLTLVMNIKLFEENK
jgi:hypothetical protein